jgi:malonyl CoA-acyl carrier protein transacylase/NADP-dependent 3-hydroxy acid dehydrogenase YdfG
MDALPAGGVMVAVRAAQAEVEPLLTGEVSLAAVNGPDSVVISGVEGAVAAVAAHFDALGRKTKRLVTSHAFHSSLMEPMLDEFGRVLAGLSFGAAAIPIVSTVDPVGADMSAVDYWVRQVRQPVRFAEAITTASGQHGATTFLELGPDGVLTALGSAIPAADDGTTTAFIPTLRARAEDPGAVITALGALHTRGVPIDWAGFFAGTRRVELPTYPFQTQRYWLDAEPVAGQAGTGQTPTDHPILRAVTPLAGTGGLVCTGWLDATTQPWLADHAVGSATVVPGTALLDMALAAAQAAGCATVDELTLHAPLVLPSDGTAVHVQVLLDTPDGDGRHPIGIHSRRDTGPDARWTHHATGLVVPAGQEPPPAFDLSTWPPADALPESVEGRYESMAALGLRYGPLFQGLRAAWRCGNEVFAEVALPAGTDVEGFAVHPALLDAALHAIGLSDGDSDDDDAGAQLPFAFTTVTQHATGATALRVRIAPTGGGPTGGPTGGRVSLQLADQAGAPVAAIESLALRPVDPDQLAAEQAEAATAGDAPPLYQVDWVPTATDEPGRPLADGRWAVLGTRELPGATELPCFADLGALADSGSGWEVVLAPLITGSAHGTGDGAAAVRGAAHRVLGMVQRFLAEDRLVDAALAVIVGSGLEYAAVSGLVRSAQAEHPGRLVLIHCDNPDQAPGVLLPAAVASGEPELRIRGMELLVPRLVGVSAAGPVPRRLDPEGTVLITGGTGGIATHLARHVVAEHGARHLVLLSRRGVEAPVAGELRDELTGLGATVTLRACDVGDRDELAAALAVVPVEHPLTAVIHAAGVLDDGIVDALTPERIDRVFGPKVDAAWHLHHLTRGQDLAAFVLLSSAAGVFGNAGQANYAAANTAVDGLAEYRHARGLAATAIAYGLWDTSRSGGMGTALTVSEQGRLGGTALSVTDGLRLFDAAVGAGRPAVVATTIGLPGREVPHLLRGLIKAQPRRAINSAEAQSLRERLAQLPTTGQHALLLRLVRDHVAGVLGHADAAAIEADRAFTTLGFDSLTSVELRNRLAIATGLRLHATVVFDHPTPTALAQHLHAQLAPAPASQHADEDESRLRAALASIPLARLREAGLLDALLGLAGPATDPAASGTPDDQAAPAGSIGSIDEMDAEALIQLALSR